jgi:hypothetical protein
MEPHANQILIKSDIYLSVANDRFDAWVQRVGFSWRMVDLSRAQYATAMDAEDFVLVDPDLPDRPEAVNRYGSA